MELGKDKKLFNRGDSDKKTIYILTGEVLLLTEDGGQTAITGGTQSSRFPIDHYVPRHATAIAKTDIKYISIDNDFLDLLLTWDQNTSYVVSDIDENESNDDTDWMTNMLRSEIFHRIPPSNIQTVLMKMEQVVVKKDDIIINQGDEGDYYYYIKKGVCCVTVTGKSGKVIKLAELTAGTGFGEEALISDNKRNATITMMTDGSLMRLGKQDFVELLKAPILQTIDFEKLKTLVKDEHAIMIDVRLEAEYKNSCIKGSKNIPLYLLRMKTDLLNKKHKYIMICDTGRRSSSAAFLLNERGFDASYLENGLMGLKHAQNN
jgi:CRP-like cAMP-binding protein